jgi:type IV secretion system protein TrbL
MACAPWNPIGCAADVAKSAASDAFSSIAHDFGNTADSAVNWFWGQTSNATAVRLGGAGFNLDLGIVATIAVTVALGLFVIQLMVSILRRDAAGLGRALKGLVVAFIGAGVAIGATNLLLAAVDSLSAGVVQAATGQSLPQLGHSVLAGSTISAASSNPAGLIVISLAALIAVAMVWAALTVRKVLIVISAVFAPLAFAGSTADITASWVRRWIEVTVALIVSKLILVIIFVVGLDMLVKGVGQAGGGHAQRATQAVSGLLVLAVAGFAPWLALKLVHWSGDQFHQIHGLAVASAAGAQKAVQAPQKAMPWVTGGGAGGLAAAAAGRASVPANSPTPVRASTAPADGARPPTSTMASVRPGATAPDATGGVSRAPGQGQLLTAPPGNRSSHPEQGTEASEAPAGCSLAVSTPVRPRRSTMTSDVDVGPGAPGLALKDPPPNGRPIPAPPWPTATNAEKERPSP